MKQENVNMVRNEQINEEWKIKENENWNQTFRHKSKEAPMLSMNCRACLKYHVKVFCFQDCNFKDSQTDLSGDDFKRTDSYIKSLQNYIFFRFTLQGGVRMVLLNRFL